MNGRNLGAKFYGSDNPTKIIMWITPFLSDFGRTVLIMHTYTNIYTISKTLQSTKFLNERIVCVVNVVEYDYWTVVRDSVTVSHQITIVALFLCIFMYTYYGTLSLRILLPLNATTFILGYLLRLCTDQHWRGFSLY
jgi:hypothetical protein